MVGLSLKSPMAYYHTDDIVERDWYHTTIIPLFMPIYKLM